jgi:hypothetical protein
MELSRRSTLVSSLAMDYDDDEGNDEVGPEEEKIADIVNFDDLKYISTNLIF